jgi:formate hydrogenlyase subunit 4
MSTGWLIGSAVIVVIVAPLIGGLLRGIDRKLTAHMQGRIGPPIVQPFYDVIKLFGKKPMIVRIPLFQVLTILKRMYWLSLGSLNLNLAGHLLIYLPIINGRGQI